MSNEIIVALISGAITLAGVLIANHTAQAVMNTKLEELTREVREHNSFAKRMPVVEEKLKVVDHIRVVGFVRQSARGRRDILHRQRMRRR